MLLSLSVLLIVTAQLSARADEPIRVLLIDGQNNHDWKATTPRIRDTLEKTGWFRVEVATAPGGADLSSFQPKFTDFDVVVSNYNGKPWSKGTMEAFEKYVRSGGGFVSVHAADNSFPKWEAYNEMIGVGGWGRRNETSGPYVRFRDGRIVRDVHKGRGGSHGRQHEFLVETRDAGHPITRGLPSSWRAGKDELYAELRGPAKNLEVLATAFSDKKTGGTGEHEPILMAIRYGEGRVFHTTLGHSTKSMEGVGFQVTLQRGTEWAARGVVTLPEVGSDLLPADRAIYRDPAEIAEIPRPKTPDGSPWYSMFDGESLEGWTQRNGTATYRIEAGAIVGKTMEGSPNSFLCSDKHYGDFELVFEVLVDDALNSGVQIRSLTKGDKPGGRVHGPQVEIATNGTAGFIYGEALGTGWLSENREGAAKKAAFQKGAWNRYRVHAHGDRIRTWVNGVPIADLEDEKSKMRRGFIGLQVHGIGKRQGPFEVRWRNLRIRELKAG